MSQIGHKEEMDGEILKMIQITKMTLNDFEVIKDILEKEFDEFWKPSILKSELESVNSTYIVAKDYGKIVGFAGILISPIDVEITNIVTRKSERKKGIGSLLLEKLIEMAQKSGRDNISLEVNENNIEAILLYEKYGFNKVGNRKKYYNGKDDALIMTKYL